MPLAKLLTNTWGYFVPIYSFLLSACCLTYIFRNRLSYFWRVNILIFILYIGGLIGTVSFGLTFGTYLFFMFSSVMTAFFVGRKQGFYMFFLSTISVILIAIGFFKGVFVYHHSKYINNIPVSWITVIIVFTFVTFVFVALISYYNIWINNTIDNIKQLNANLNRNLIDNSPLGIIVFHAETGACVECNETLATMVGGSKTRILSQNFKQVNSWRISGLYDLAQKVIQSGQPATEEILLMTSFGKEMCMYCTMSIFFSEDEKYLLCSLEDHTEKRRIEDELNSYLF